MIEYIIGGVVILIGLAGIRRVQQVDRGLIERFGKYNRFATPGFNWIIPLIETYTPVNVTEMMVDAQPQEIITLDKLNAVVDAQVYFRVQDNESSVKASKYNVNNYKFQIVSLTRTTLRNIIGTMNLTEANSERGRINVALMETLTKETSNWGIMFTRAELKEINPPQDVQKTMNSVVQAENTKIAALDFALAKENEADGFRKAAIKQAEGERQAAILRAEASKQSSILVAEGQAKAFDLINKAFTGNAITLKQLEVTQASLENNSKIVITEEGISPTLVIGEGNVIPVKGKVR